MRFLRHSRFTPDWLFTYTAVMLVMGVAVNWGAGFTQFAHSLTLPSMEVDLSLSHTKAGFVVTLTAMVRMTSTIISGTLAPRYGSRFIIGVGTAGAGGAMILLASAQSYPLALLSAALMGVGTGMALTPMMGLLTGWFQASDRGLAAGLAATGGSFAFIFAGVIVPWLVGRDADDGWRNAWAVFGALSIAIGLVSLLFLRERPSAQAAGAPEPNAPEPQSQRQGAWPIAAYKNPMIWLITFLAFNSGWSQNIFTSFFGVYLNQEHGIKPDHRRPTGHLDRRLKRNQRGILGAAVGPGQPGTGFLLLFLVAGRGIRADGGVSGDGELRGRRRSAGIHPAGRLHHLCRQRRGLCGRSVLGRRLRADVGGSGPGQRRLADRGRDDCR
ncbi:MAG: MFS transporter [Chloroflexi bacterium]|nr:MFS transporter [Chloroflexota bacterium]MDA1271475.1 MFS transporter [Chloroflexota bacterium]